MQVSDELQVDISDLQLKAKAEYSHFDDMLWGLERMLDLSNDISWKIKEAILQAKIDRNEAEKLELEKQRTKESAELS